MPIQTVCAACSVKIKVRDELIGKAIKCPRCGQRFAVAAEERLGTEALAASQAGPPSDLLGKTEQVPGAAAPGPDLTSDLAPEARPAITDCLSIPDAGGTQDFAAQVQAEPAATACLATPKADSSATRSVPPMPVGDLQSLGGYRIVRELGQGGMGAVYEAEDGKLKRRVALKVMKPEIARHQAHRERFLREARTAAKVKSDFICPIYRVGEDDGVPFIAMQLLKGEPLDGRRKQALRLPPGEVVRIGKEVAQGLSVAHEAGLVHRDIKPANIWLETQRAGPPRAIILDFGLARMQADDVQITQSGAIMGTPAFMSPEQARGDKNVDARTDLFSLGCVLYALCTGELPFQGDTTMGVLMALATHDPTPPRQLAPDTPKALSRLIMRLLAKHPDDRPQSAEEVIEELLALEADPAHVAEGTFTTQVEAPAPSARISKPKRQRAEPTMTMRRPRQPAAKASARMGTTTYVIFGVIAVGLLGCVVTVAAGGVYYYLLAGRNGQGADHEARGQEYTLKIKAYPDAGKSVTTNESFKMNFGIKMAIGGKVLKEEKKLDAEVKQFVEKTLEADQKGRVRYTRTYTKATKSEDGAPLDRSFAGKTVTFERKDGKYVASGDGVDAKDLNELAKSANSSTDEQKLLPSKAVKVGDTWTIDENSLLAVLGDMKGDADLTKLEAHGKLVKAYKKAGAQWGTLEFTVSVPLSAFGPLHLQKAVPISMKITIDTAIDGSTTAAQSQVVFTMQGSSEINANGQTLHLNLAINGDGREDHSAEK